MTIAEHRKNSVAVLGRGQSLQVYRDYSNLVSKVYIVNNFNTDLWDVGASHFKGKEIIHVTSRKGPNALSRKNYLRFKIRRVQSNAFQSRLIDNAKSFSVRPQTMPDSMRQRGYEPYGWENILAARVSKRKSPNLRAWPTTGLLAIDLALVENHPCNLYLFGFDMYDAPYFCGKIKEQDGFKKKMMSVHLQKLVHEFSDTTFYCGSDVSLPSMNWHTVGRDESKWFKVPTKDFLAKQIYKDKFNRMDVVARYLAIEDHFGKNNIGWKIYKKMQTIRMNENPKGARERIGMFIDLINSVKENGYLYNKPIRAKDDFMLVNGAHRLAAALYFGVEEVLVWKDDSTKKKPVFNLKWFRKNRFKPRYIDAIEQKAKELCLV